MKLRVKIPSIMGLVIVVVVFGLYLLITNIFLGEAVSLERNDLKEDVSRTKSAIDLDISTLKVTVGDYAFWDDTYDFVVSKDQKYIDANFGSASFANLHVNAVIIRDVAGKVVYSKGFDTDKNTEITLSAKYFSDLNEEDDLLKFKTPKQANGEIALIDAKPRMVVARQIIKSDETGPVRGVIVMVRDFDENYIANLAELTKMKISEVQKTDEKSLNELFKPEWLTQPDVKEMIRPLDDKTIEAAFVLSCDENPVVAVLRIEKYRSIYQLALTSVGEILGILVVFGILLVILLLVLTDFMVVKRLVRMSSKIEKFNFDSSKSPNLKIEGKDELASSSKIIDSVFKHVVKTKMALNNSMQEIQDEKDKLNAILDSEGDMIVVLDAKGNIVLFNDESERITGIKLKNALGKSFMAMAMLVPKEGQKLAIKRFEDVLERGIPSEDHILVLENVLGKRVPIEVSEHPIHYRGDKKTAGCVVVGRDITEEYKIDQMKSEFVSLASHQLKSPLTGIKWMISLLSDKKTGSLNPTQTEYLKNVNDSNERMIKLINNMLNISRLESGKSQVERTTLNLRDLISEVITAQSVGAKERKIELVARKEGPPKILIKADRDKLYEVLMNLVNNAVKYSKDNGNVEVKVNSTLEKKKVIISVKDSGIGIPAEQQSRVFEKFFRADNALKTVSMGTGLGLYYVKSVVEAHGGKIWFESKKDKGSTFYVSLPM